MGRTSLRRVPGALRVGSVSRAVAAFLVAGLVVLTTVAVLLAVSERRAATVQAIRAARTLTTLKAADVVGPLLTDVALRSGAQREALDRVVRTHVLGPAIVRVKIWNDTGQVVYSDDRSLIGLRSPLAGDKRVALLTGRTSAQVSDLADAENRDEKQFGKLLEVYLGVKTPSGRRLLFETYQPYRVITEASRRMWLASLPVLLGGLLLLYAVQAPLAYRMASRLKRSQDEREALLLSSLAASDRERSVIAADLHDGIVQGLAGASLSLSAAAQRVRATAPDTAKVMAATAAELRRWVRELRSLVVTITPPALHAQGLGPSLTDLVATLEVRGLSVHVDLTDANANWLDETTETLVYRAAQEAVRNIVRHADATTVTLTVARSTTPNASRNTQELLLRVVDDGRGFEVNNAQTHHEGSVGLQLLSQLVEAHGGTLSIDTSPGHGTSVVLRLPLPANLPKPALASAVPTVAREDIVRARGADEMNTQRE